MFQIRGLADDPWADTQADDPWANTQDEPDPAFVGIAAIVAGAFVGWKYVVPLVRKKSGAQNVSA